ncbi:hypothetical protein OESDEN_19090 [Oesophagostomum dentatum]|uniref:Uncharacterized protein n=1 Tax=Oesophagostomum dentatum TaxID=61180 RepID=A0A0B1S8H2_OESDE|nr:hypothetical protein OESDEN_19090 [Oesophagostomum dentatum]
MARKRKLSCGDGGGEPSPGPVASTAETPEPSTPTAEMVPEPSYCPFAASNPETNSPACSEPSLSPCPSPDQLMIDEPLDEENSSEI